MKVGISGRKFSRSTTVSQSAGGVHSKRNLRHGIRLESRPAESRRFSPISAASGDQDRLEKLCPTGDSCAPVPAIGSASMNEASLSKRLTFSNRACVPNVDVALTRILCKALFFRFSPLDRLLVWSPKKPRHGSDTNHTDASGALQSSDSEPRCRRIKQFPKRRNHARG